MIEELLMYRAVCDRCGSQDDEGDYVAWTDAESALTVAIESEWQQIDDRLVCRNCWQWSEDESEMVESPPLQVQP